MYLFSENFKQKKYMHCSALQIVNVPPVSFTIFCLLTHFFWPHDEYIADIIAFNTTYVLHVNKHVKYGYQIQEFNINIFI